MDSLIDLGYWGLFIGSFLASTVIPFSADLLLIGLLALGGNIWLCVAIATVGNWLGGLTSYWIGWIGKWEWIERWLKVTPVQLEKQKNESINSAAYLLFLPGFPLSAIFSPLLSASTKSTLNSPLYICLSDVRYVLCSGRFFTYTMPIGLLILSPKTEIHINCKF